MKKNFHWRTVALLVVWLSAVACEQADRDEIQIQREMDMDAGSVALKNAPATTQASSPASEQSSPVTKKIIKTGSIDFQSESVEQDYRKIMDLLPVFHAYLENENQSRSEQQIYYHLTVRVTSEHFDSLFLALTQMAVRLNHKSSYIEDVTEQFYDLETRIKNKKALEQRYVELLVKAGAVKDILEIEKSLNEIRTEIEQLEGQFNYLSKRISYSTIHLSFYETLPYTYHASQREGLGARILNALDSGWQGFLTFMVGLVSFWPFLLLIAAGIFVFKKIRLRRNL